MVTISRRCKSLGVCLLLGTSLAGPARAALTLTAEGISSGFQLSTVVGGFFGTYGPLGEAMLPNGNFITGSYSSSQLYIFKNVDGQSLSDALSVIPYTFQTSNPQYVMAIVGGNAYGAQVAGGTIVEFANDGSTTPVPGLGGVTAYYGMWGNVKDGHLVASSNLSLIDIDPTGGSYRVINSTVFPDGVTVSPDGTTIFAAVGGNVNSYSTATGSLLNSFSGNGRGPDGTGVIIGGAFDSDVVVNNNDGTVTLLDPRTGVQTIIAQGGHQRRFRFRGHNEWHVVLIAVRPDCSPILWSQLQHWGADSGAVDFCSIWGRLDSLWRMDSEREKVVSDAVSS